MRAWMTTDKLDTLKRGTARYAPRGPGESPGLFFHLAIDPDG
jgi:hypothetical protein